MHDDRGALGSLTGRRYVRVADAEFLGSVPAWFRDKSACAIQPVTDLARVTAAIRLLRSGATEVVWVDADVVVFDADRLVMPDEPGVALTREVWLDVERPTGRPSCVERVNNSVLVASDLAFLEDYRETCLRIARQSVGPLAKSAVSTTYLTDLHCRRPFALVRHVGNLSPPVLRAVVHGGVAVLDCYGTQLGEPLFAANLCASYENTDYFGTVNVTADYERAVAALVATRGEVLSPK